MIERLEEMACDADDCGEGAVADKIQEAFGPLRSARLAATQYAHGTLTRA